MIESQLPKNSRRRFSANHPELEPCIMPSCVSSDVRGREGLDAYLLNRKTYVMRYVGRFRQFYQAYAACQAAMTAAD